MSSRDRLGSDRVPTRRRRTEAEEEDEPESGAASSLASPRRQKDAESSRALERIERAERIEAERRENDRAEEQAKEQRRRARAERKASADAESGALSPISPTPLDDDEEAARLARRAARRAARLAAEQQAAAPVVEEAPAPRASARQTDLVRDMLGEREEAVPRFRRAMSGADVEDTAGVFARRPVRKEPEEEEAKPRRRPKREDGGASEEITSPRRKLSASAGPAPEASLPRSRDAAVSAASKPQVIEEVAEVEEEAETAKEDADHVPSLPSPASSIESGGRTITRSGSFSSAQKSLDVAGLNRVLKNIPAAFFQRDNFNPFTHWNEPKEQLTDWMEYVDVAVEKVVDAYHKGFNTATSSFSHVLQKFSESQKLVKKLQENLTESKRLLASRNHNLKDYFFQNRMAAKMKEILEKVEYVIEVPAWIDRYMERKQYVHAVVLLQHTLALLVSDDLVGIDGLLDLREEILVRKHFVQQFLVEELHRIIYSKSIDSNAHLRFQSKGQREQQQAAAANAESVLAFNADGTRVIKTAPLIDPHFSAHHSPTLGAQSHHAAPRPTPADSKYSPFHTTAFMLDDGESGASEVCSASLQALLKEEAAESYVKNPEASPHKFLSLLVESLHHMNHLPSVKTQVNKRVRDELLTIIGRETAQAQAKAKFAMPRRALARATESGYLTQGSELLVDLIERIFHVLAHVLKNHLDVIGMIQARLGSGGLRADGTRSSEADTKFSIEGMWQVIQIVLQTTLTDYLHSSDAGKRQAKVDVRVTNKNTKGKKPAVQDLLNDLTFSFEDSSAPSVAKLSRGEKVQNAREYRAKVTVPPPASTDSVGDFSIESMTAHHWIQATPYNITAVYRPVVNFTDHANAMIRASIAGGHVPASPASNADDDSLSETNQLRNFLKIFIEVSFLPRVEADVNIRLDEVLNDPSAFDARERERDSRYLYNTQAAAASTSPSSPNSSSASGLSGVGSAVSPPLRAFPCAEVEHNLLLKCVLDISDVLRKKFQDMYLLPHSMPDYLRIIDSITARLMEKCRDKFNSELVQHASGSGSGWTPTPQSRLLAADDKFMSLIEDDPLLRVLRVGDQSPMALDDDDDDEVLHYFSHINPIYSPMFQRNTRFDRTQLQFDTRIWSQLSLMAESLEWMADRIFHMNVFSPELSRIWQEGEAMGGAAGRGGPMKNGPRRPGGKFSSRHGPRLEPFRVHQYLEMKRHGENGMPKFLASKSPLDQKRWQLAESCLALADRCLFTLRLELHSHLFFFLKEMQSGAYWCANDSTEPEPFVIELNRDLTFIDDAVSKYLSTTKKKYVFGGCLELTTNLLVSSLRHLQDKRVNSKGVAKICRNFFALQQNLNNIEGATTAHTTAGSAPHATDANTVHRQERHFDRARQYYELLNYSTEELHLFQLENPDVFSSEEYGALLSVATATRAADPRF